MELPKDQFWILKDHSMINLMIKKTELEER